MFQFLTQFYFWGQSGCVLDKTQTFIGVLATLIVLCLIRDKTNFIFKLVQTIHLESDIIRYTNDLNRSIKEGYTLTDLIERITTRRIDVMKLPEKLRDELLKEWRQVEIQPNIFKNYADGRNDAYKKRYEMIRDRQEGTFNARFSFVILLFVMLVDCWPINESVSCLFLLFLLILYVNFTSVLWIKYVMGKSKRKHVYFTKTRGLVLSFLFLFTAYFLALAGIANHSLTHSGTIFVFALAFITAFGLMAHYKVCGIDNSEKYNNGWIAKHAAYITFCSMMLALITLYITEWVEDMASNTPLLFHLRWNISNLSDNLGIMRALFVSYVAFNTFFLEVLVCYFYNLWFKFKNMDFIKDKYRDCKRQKKLHLRKCKLFIYNNLIDGVKGEIILPNREYRRRISFRHRDYIFNLRCYKWG